MLPAILPSDSRHSPSAASSGWTASSRQKGKIAPGLPKDLLAGDICTCFTDLEGTRLKAAGEPRAVSISGEGQVGHLKKMAENIPDKRTQAASGAQSRSQTERALWVWLPGGLPGGSSQANEGHRSSRQSLSQGFPTRPLSGGPWVVRGPQLDPHILKPSAAAM